MHHAIAPAILYFGTPVVLVSTLNEDASPNLAPISSVFWLGWRCMLGFTALSKTPGNLLRTRECVLNLPSVQEAAAVNRLALTTGSQSVPAFKQSKGYRHVADKFQEAGLTPLPSQAVAAPRVRECPVQLEAVVEATHRMADQDPKLRGFIICFELRIQCVHAEESVCMSGHADRIDPDKWRPLLMSFQKFYGLGPEVYPSTLANTPEQSYRSPDMERARFTAT